MSRNPKAISRFVNLSELRSLTRERDRILIAAQPYLSIGGSFPAHMKAQLKAINRTIRRENAALHLSAISAVNQRGAR